MRAMSTLLNHDMVLEQYRPQDKTRSSGRMLDHWIASLTLDAMGDALFPRQYKGQHESAIAAILIDRHLNAHRGSSVSTDIFNQIYDHIQEKGYLVSTTQPWIGQTYAIYGVRIPQHRYACTRWFRGPKQDLSVCYYTIGENKLLDLMSYKKPGHPQAIKMLHSEGMKRENSPKPCTQWSETPSSFEHYVAANPIELGKGWYYFVFDTEPTETEINLYLISDKASLLLSWLNQSGSQGKWNNLGEHKHLEPVFVQAEVLPQLVNLSVLIYSAMPQKVQVRWQHGRDGTTIYEGTEKSQSRICAAHFGQLDDAH